MFLVGVRIQNLSQFYSPVIRRFSTIRSSVSGLYLSTHLKIEIGTRGGLLSGLEDGLFSLEKYLKVELGGFAQFSLVDLRLLFVM